MSGLLITPAKLRAAGACPGQRKVFAKMFPTGTTVTLSSVRRCAKAELDLGWFASAFLSAPARAAYCAATAPAWAAYCAATAQAQGVYDAATASAWAAYCAAKATALVRAWNRGRGAK